MILVAVTNPDIASHLSGIDGIEVIEVAPGGPVPPAAAGAEVLVPGVLAGPDAVELLAGLPALQLVQLMTAGAEVWIGRTPPGVTLCTARGAHGGSTAEWAVGAMLAVLHEFPGFVQRQREGHWDRHRTDELAGKRVLVLGAGDLANQLRRRLLPFDVTVTMAGRTARPGVLGTGDVAGVLGEVDVVVAMVPLTEETRGMIDAEFLAAMPDNAVLINAARGQIVDTSALIAELASGRLRAAIDVTDPEPLPDGHPLWSVPNLFITPHIAGAVPGASGRALEVIRQQLQRFAAGESLQNVVGDCGY